MRDDLLDILDVTGAVVTVDALHTQHETATKIRAEGGHYVFTVKADQKHLYQQFKALPWKGVPSRTIRDTGHGRKETRTIKAADVPAWIELEGATQIAQLPPSAQDKTECRRHSKWLLAHFGRSHASQGDCCTGS